MFRLDGKVALITGGSSGIGRAIAELFAEVGARVAIVSRRLSAGQETVAHLTLMGGQAIHIQADVTQEEDVKRSLAATLERYGRLDIVVNNAGINRRVSLEATTDDDWQMTFDVNVRGAFLYAKHAIPHFQAQRQGCIINIAGLLGVKGGAGASPAFAASKGALVTPCAMDAMASASTAFHPASSRLKATGSSLMMPPTRLPAGASLRPAIPWAA
jgi:NAD(P)-dependent dehydrogenase (short-subunit alcohol dehydrogenase family)